MGIHLKLVTPYINVGKSINLPKSVGTAQEYTDWNEQIDNDIPLWKRFRANKA